MYNLSLEKVYGIVLLLVVITIIIVEYYSIFRFGLGAILAVTTVLIITGITGLIIYAVIMNMNTINGGEKK